MKNKEYKELLAESGGATIDSVEKKSVKNPPRFDKKAELTHLNLQATN